MQEFVTAQRKRVTVAVDAMGGDLAPHAVVAGVVAAARTLPGADIVLVGDEETVRACLATQGAVPANVTVRHASQTIDMCEAPGAAIRHKRDSSIVVGMRMVRDGQAHAIISAGSSGAMMTGAMLILKAQPGIDRPAIATLLPTKRGHAILLDAGATVDCRSDHLVQFAHLGSAYAASVFERPSPRVGLLSIGEEPSKGDELTKETHKLLLATEGINFIGNVEPKEVIQGDVDVVVCDGFVGNLMLKTAEGFGELIMSSIKREICRGWVSRLAAFMLKPAFMRVKRLLDYAEYGGMELLGVNGVVVISHGRSNAHAIENAVRVAARAAQRQTNNGATSPCRNERLLEARSQ